MHEFSGDLLIGGSAIRHLHGALQEDDQGGSHRWSGHFQIDPCQCDDLQIGRQYLLLLNDGRNAEVIVTQVRSEQQAVVCKFEPWLEPVAETL